MYFKMNSERQIVYVKMTKPKNPFDNQALWTIPCLFPTSPEIGGLF